MAELGDIGVAIQPKGRPVDVLLAGLASRQHGVVAAWQLLDQGVTRAEIRWRLEHRRLHPLYRGVYAVGHTSVSAHGRVLAAVLAYGPDAFASHRSGAWVFNLLWDNRTRTDVTVVGRSAKPRAGITVHRPRYLADEDRTVRDGIPCTSVARILLDVAGSEPLRRLRRAFEEAERQRVLDMSELERLLATTRGHPGVKPLAALAEDAAGPPPMTRSDVEEALRDLCRAEGIPLPAMNVPVGEYELDAVWFDEKVAIEIDHYATHGHRTAFERDRVRDIDVHLAGFLPGRITDVQLTRNPRETAARLRRLLARGAQVAKAA